MAAEDYNIIQTASDSESIRQYSGMLGTVFGKPELFTEAFIKWQYADNPTNFVNGPTVFRCPSARFLAGEVDPFTRVAFSYGINFKGTNGVVPATTPFRATVVRHPSAFVFYSDNRANSVETPFYGANPLNDLGAPRGSLNHLSSRHAAGANLTLLDGHSEYFKYAYLCYPKGTKIGDPGNADVNWTYDGTPSQ